MILNIITKRIIWVCYDRLENMVTFYTGESVLAEKQVLVKRNFSELGEGSTHFSIYLRYSHSFNHSDFCGFLANLFWLKIWGSLSTTE